MSDVRSVLFDEPGPRGRRRIRVVTALSLLAIAALAWLAVDQFAANGQLAGDKWRLFGEWPIWRYLLGGLGATAEATAVCAVLATPIGALLALGRLSRRWWLRVPVAAWVELFRSLPVLLLLYVFLLVLPRVGLTLPIFWQLVVPIVVSGSATLSEIFRAGVLSLEHGQTEAAYSIGLTHAQAMRIVVLPQVVRRLLPALVTQVISLLKDTTLGYVVSYAELLNSGKVLGEYSHALIQTYIVVALLFILGNAALSRFAHLLERRQPGSASLRRRLATTGMEDQPAPASAAG